MVPMTTVLWSPSPPVLFLLLPHQVLYGKKILLPIDSPFQGGLPGNSERGRKVAEMEVGVDGWCLT